MLMPSEMESFGLAALEAMACRVPSISTNVGGVPRAYRKGRGVNGLLFEVGDVEGMATAAIDLLSDPERLEKISSAGRRTAQDHFCSSRIIPLYENYYRRVLDRSHK